MSDYWQIGDTYRIRYEIATIGGRGKAIFMEMGLPDQVVLKVCGKTHLQFEVPETKTDFFLTKEKADEVYTNQPRLQMSPQTFRQVKGLHV